MARKCLVCGTAYTYCRSCPKDAKKETWYALYDNENCKNISQALTDYNFNKITKEEAKEMLAGCDLSINLMEYYRNTLDAVMAKPKRTPKVKVVLDDPIEIIEPVNQEPSVEEEPNGVVITE